MPPSWWSLKRDQKTVKQVAFDIFMNVRQLSKNIVKCFLKVVPRKPYINKILDDSNKFKFP